MNPVIRKPRRFSRTDLVGAMFMGGPLVSAVLVGIQLGADGVLVGLIVGYPTSRIGFWLFQRMVNMHERRQDSPTRSSETVALVAVALLVWVTLMAVAISAPALVLHWRT